VNFALLKTVRFTEPLGAHLAKAANQIALRGFLPQFHRTRFRLRNQFLAPRDLPRTLAGVAPLNRSA